METIERQLEGRDPRAQALRTLSVKMEKRDLFLKGGKEPVERFQAVVRMDTGNVLSVVSPGYQLMTHDEVFGAVTKLLQQEGWELQSVRMERDGAHAFVTAHNPEINLMKGTKELVTPRVVICHGVDLRTGLKVMFGAYRKVCTNGLVVLDSRYETMKLATTHTGDLEGRLVGFGTKLKGAIELLQKFGPTYRSLMEQPVKPEEAEPLLRGIVGKRQLDRINHLWEHAPGQPKPHDTGWGLYNGLTYWLTHEAKGGIYARDLKSRMLLSRLVAKTTQHKG